MKRLTAKSAGIILLYFSAVLIMLVVGIKKDLLLLEAGVLIGTGVILMLVKEPAWIIYLQLFYCCINKFLISQLGISSASNYVTDILMILCFLLALKRFIERKKKTGLLIPMIIVGLFFLVGTVSALFQQASLTLLLWSYRNIMRFYLFFFSCAVILDFGDVKRLMRFSSVVFWLNVLVSSYQFWVQGFRQDFLGGLFGTDAGCNGHMNTFLCMYLAYVCVMYMEKKVSFWYFLLASGGCLYIAAVSELKFLFIEFVLILMLSIFICRFSLRTLGIILGAFVGLFVGLRLFDRFFPGWSFSIQQIVDYAGRGGYSTAKDLNRLNALQRIGKEFLYRPANFWFGFGLGSCETSAFFNSAFFAQYGTTLHYTYLIHAFTFLETGLVGLLLYVGFYADIALNAWKAKICLGGERKVYCEVAAVFSVMCIAHCMYNNALRVENSGYLAYFILAIPFICMKGREQR